MWFDVSAPESERRDVALPTGASPALSTSPLMLGVTHLLITIACVLLSPALHSQSAVDNPLIPSALVIALDVARGRRCC